MSDLSFKIASGAHTTKQTGGMYSKTRVDRKEMSGTGLGRDIAASVVQAALPKVVGLLTDYGTSKLVKKIKGNGKKGGSYRLH